MDGKILERAKKIKLLILDADGVMTDGRIYYGNYGDEIKAFDVKDGFGVLLLKRARIETVVVTAKKSRVVKLRARDCGIRRVYENAENKLKVCEKLARKFRITLDEVCFVGDDLIDVPLLKRAGLSVTVPQATDDVKKVTHYITRSGAGSGAVREVCELIIRAQGKWDDVTKKYFL